MVELVRGRQGQIEITLRDGDGNATDATGAVTVGISDGAGTPMSGSPFTAEKPPNTTGVYRLTLAPALLGVLDVHEATWTASVGGVSQTVGTRFEVVGAVIFGIADLRELDADITAAAYPAQKVREARAKASEQFEALAAIAFRRRGRRATLDGTGGPAILVPDLEPRGVVSATVDAGSGPVALTAADLSDLALYPHGEIVRMQKGVWQAGVRNVAIHYEHGLDEAPEPARHAVMLLARARLVRGPVPDRATSVSTDEGVFRYSTPGRDGPTGIPDVDAAIAQFGRALPAVG